MDTLETNSDEVNVEGIMKKIRENIQKKGIEVYPKEFCEIQNGTIIKECYDCDIIKNDFEYINSNWNVQNNGYLISSHRQAVGKLLIKGRELVHGEVKRYVNPMMEKQTVFNESTVNILNNVANNISFLDNKVEQITPNIDLKIRQLKPDIDIKVEKMKSDIAIKIEQMKSETDIKIEQIKLDTDIKIEKMKSETVIKTEQIKSLSTKSTVSMLNDVAKDIRFLDSNFSLSLSP